VGNVNRSRAAELDMEQRIEKLRDFDQFGNLP
jgi:hypothetical protein